MAKANGTVEAAEPTLKIAYQIGFWAAILMTVLTAVAFAIAIATPPISGPFCRSGCISYPYAGVASNVPNDYLWLYPALFIAPLFLVLSTCLHHHVSSGKRIYSQIGLSLVLAYTIMVSLDYYIQITVIQPSLLQGETDGLALFLQYNPHGVFIALEDLGYLMMSMAFFFIGMALGNDGKIERALRWLFVISPVLAVGSYIVLSVIYGNNLEYRFEVLVITLNWTTLVVAGILSSILFWRILQSEKEEAL